MSKNTMMGLYSVPFNSTVESTLRADGKTDIHTILEIPLVEITRGEKEMIQNAIKAVFPNFGKMEMYLIFDEIETLARNGLVAKYMKEYIPPLDGDKPAPSTYHDLFVHEIDEDDED